MKTHSPPLEALVVFYWPVDAERNPAEPPEVAHNENDEDAEDRPLRGLGQSTSAEEEVIREMCEHEDSEVKSGKLEAIHQEEKR